MNIDKLTLTAIEYQTALAAWFKAKEGTVRARDAMKRAETAEKQARVVVEAAEAKFKSAAHDGAVA